MKMPLATFEGMIRVGQEKAAIAEEITLTFGYAEAVHSGLVEHPPLNGVETPAPTPLRAAVNA
jgi:3-hydroxyacyl-[acyl-carrier-protein] dehydratase